jgi:hypothetical protein
MPTLEASIGLRLDDIRNGIDALPERLTAQAQAELREQARGIKYMRQVYDLPGDTGNATLTGPEQGFAWDLKLVSVTMSDVDSLAVYVGESAGARLIGYSNPGTATASAGQPLQVVKWSSHQVVIHPTESIYIETSGTADLVLCMIGAVQVPAEMLGKIIT